MQVIKASAGSGKTYTLAKRYLEELLFVTALGKRTLRSSADYYQHILAITFTNKATNEMKTRIVDELFVLAQDPERSSYYQNEWKQDNLQATDLKKAAQKALSTLLFNYSEFKVSTIDSFFQSILRNFARELDHDYNYDLQLDSNYATSVATHNFLLTLGHDLRRTGKSNTTAAQWVKDYINDSIVDDKSWNNIFGDKENSLARFARKINDEFFREHMPVLRNYLSSDHEGKSMERIARFTRLLKDKAREWDEKRKDCAAWQKQFQELCARLGIDERYLNGRRILYRIFHSGACTDDTLNKQIEKGVESDLFKSKFEPTQEQQSAIMDFLLQVSKCSRYSSLLYDIARKLSYVGLMGEINKKLEEYREESNTVLIADTNELIGRVVETSDTPFIYERTGTWINHYMLDEFQDTSRKQYENFKPLLNESLSNGNPNLIIGDSKQAIYRFRNADPSLFREQLDKDYSSHIELHPLTVNWRSHKSIIDFNNEFTGRFLDLFTDYRTLQDTYRPANLLDKGYRQELSSPRAAKHKGLVRVHFGTIEDGEELPFEKIDNITPLLPEHLKELHTRFEWSDIIILVNKKKDGESVVATLLEWNKQHPDDMIPVVSGELMRLDQSNAVQRIVSMLRFIDLTSYALSEDSTDDPNYDSDLKTRANNRRMKQQRQFRVLEEFEKRLGQLPDATPVDNGTLLDECFSAANTIAQLNKSEQMSTYAADLKSRLPNQRTQAMSLVNIIEHLINKTITPTERDQECIFLHALLNCTIEFASKNNGGTVREFLRYWDQNRETITVPDSGTNVAIQVYTIHKSKGLEADCVVIPCANWDINTNSLDHDYWVDGKEWLDDGGREWLSEVAPGEWSEELVPPIMSMGKSRLRAMGAYNLFKHTCNKQDEDLVIDNVNKTYVAFTRPRKELHIYSLSASKSLRSISDVLNHVISQSEDHMGFHKVNAMQFDLGAPYDKSYEEAAKSSDDKPSYDNQPLPPYTVSDTHVMVSLPDDETSARQLGKRLHTLLSRIGYVNQLNKALSYCERRGIISGNAADEWNKYLLQRFLSEKLSQQPFAQWFAPDNTVYNERTLLVVDSHGEKSFKRPDRIVKRPNGTFIVIDYKFGQRNEANDKKYMGQVQAYVNALASTTSHTVEGYVWYVTQDEVVAVN